MKKAKGYVSNWQIKRLDESIIMGLILTFFAGWCSWFKEDEFKLNDEQLIYVFLFTTLVLHFLGKLMNSRKLTDEGRYIERKLAGSINDTIKLMFNSGLVLKNINQNIYFFKTRNIILPNDSFFLVKDCGDHCSVIGHQDEFKRLGIEILSKEFEIGSNDASNNR